MAGTGEGTGTPIVRDGYCTRSDIEGVFGVENVKTWADLDGDGDAGKIAARIESAIIWVSNYVDARLRNTHTTPLSPDVIDPVLIDIAANLAGTWLYESRGVQDFDPETGKAVHRLIFNEQKAEKGLARIIAGTLNPAADKQTQRHAPFLL